MGSAYFRVVDRRRLKIPSSGFLISGSYSRTLKCASDMGFGLRPAADALLPVRQPGTRPPGKGLRRLTVTDIKHKATRTMCSMLTREHGVVALGSPE